MGRGGYAVDSEGCPVVRSTRREVEADTVANAKFRWTAEIDRCHADRSCEAGYRTGSPERRKLRARGPALRLAVLSPDRGKTLVGRSPDPGKTLGSRSPDPGVPLQGQTVVHHDDLARHHRRAEAEEQDDPGSILGRAA